VLWLTGCGHQDDSKVVALEKRVVAAETRADAEKEDRERLATEIKGLKDELAKAPKVAPNESAPGLTRDDVRAEIKSALESLRKELAQAKPADTSGTGGNGPTAKVDEPKEKTEAEKAKEIEEAKTKLAEKLGRFYENVSDHAASKDVYELLWQVDAKTRKEVVDKLKALVAENPEDKNLRIALAQALTTTFRDVKTGIEQGILAGNIMKEAKKASQIDPDFYDAVAFVAVFKANYPEGFTEFAEAYKDLDKALELQSKMTWEDRFGEIYVAYGRWYFKPAWTRMYEIRS
jgi:predicted Zn-dependent protease